MVPSLFRHALRSSGDMHILLSIPAADDLHIDPFGAVDPGNSILPAEETPRP